MTMQKKITVLILLAGIIPLLVIVGVAHYLAYDSLVDSTLVQMEMLRATKKTAVEQYFAQRKKDLALLTQSIGDRQSQTEIDLRQIRDSNQKHIADYFTKSLKEIENLANNEDLAQTMATLDWVYREANKKTDGEKWTTIAEKKTGGLEKFRATNGFEDLYLISQRGDIFFTASRGPELGTYVKGKKGRLTPLGQLLSKSLDKATFQDYLPSKVSGAKPLAYLAAPVKRNDKVIGIVAVSLNTQKMLSPMLTRDGLSNKGTIYLVGPDQKLRSTLLVGSEKTAHKAPYSINKEAVEKALVGDTGSGIIANRGKPRLAAWKPLMVGETTWAIITETDPEESFAGSNTKGLDKSYLDATGYYDLFLIKPNGLVFHTAAHQRDYGTNLLNGPYADSSLTKLLKTVLKTKKPGMTDISPYAPSNGEPSAFMAAPIIHNGIIEMVVALQLPIEELTQILAPGKNLGKNGDIYLVGPDKRMRSDSRRHPETHSVSASFNGSMEKNGKDIPAVVSALKGESGTVNSSDNSTLYAYTPISFNSFNWALILESGPSGGGGVLSKIINNLNIVVLCLIPLLVLLAIFGAKSTVNPLAAFTELIAQLSQGNFAATLHSRHQGNMGNLANQVIEMTERLGQTSVNIRRAATELIQQGQVLAKVAKNQNPVPVQNEVVSDSDSVNVDIDLEPIIDTINALATSLEKENSQALATEQTVEMTSMDIAEGSQAINEAVLASRDVSERIFVIEEASRQLRLMAMNAAIEAARSGVTSEAFVETAKEMRRLAEKSRIGASEIHRLSTANTRGTKQAGEILTNLSPVIRKSIELIQKHSADRKAQKEQLKNLLVELKQLDQQRPVEAQTITEKPGKISLSNKDIEKQIAKLNQKSQALLEALAFFIPPEEEL
ncbi:MAG: methyl-accepting chemotaxis protein [Magnetococcales bacterium]|nr:methyl-accepting chemotaxis protein [Magnetococcales bacterium]